MIVPPHWRKNSGKLNLDFYEMKDWGVFFREIELFLCFKGFFYEIFYNVSFITSCWSQGLEGVLMCAMNNLIILWNYLNYDVKKSCRTATITITQDLDKDLQQQIVEEGVNVFKFNNSIIHTVEGVDEIFYKKIFKWIGILLFILMIIFAYFMI